MSDFRVGPLRAHVGGGIWWARLWERGPGLLLKDTRRRPLLYSERVGRGWQLGRWRLRVL